MSLGPIEPLLDSVDSGLADLSINNVGEILKVLDGFQQEPLVLLHRGVLTKYVRLLCSGFFETGSSSGEERLARCKVFYTLSKVVGWKRIVNYLPTDVYLLRELVPLLESEMESNWYIEFFVLSWVYVLCLSPFKLEISQRIYRLVSKFKATPSVAPIVVKIHAQLLVEDREFFHLVKDELDLSTGVSVVKLCLNRDDPVVDKQSLDRFTSMGLEGKADASRLKMLPKLFRMHMFYEDAEALQNIITWILSRLSDDFTETRFSLAHSYAKIVKAIMTELDDRETAQDLIESCLKSTMHLCEDVPWEVVDRNLLHTYLLIIAELSTTIATYFPHCTLQITERVVPYASRFQQLKTNTIQGSQIRDASNFICWSLARSVNRNKKSVCSSKGMTDVFLNVLMCSTFDRELLIRKSANAALQEILGRYVSFSGLLDNSAILRILEMPITNLPKNFTPNTIQLYQLFSKNRKLEFSKFMLLWLFDYCVMSNNDLSIVQLATNALCALAEKEPISMKESGLSERINQFVSSTALDAARFLYLLVHLDSQELIYSKDHKQIAFKQVEVSVKGKRFTKNHYELFKSLALLEYFTLMLQKCEEFRLLEEHVELFNNIVKGYSENMAFFNEIVHTLRTALSLLSTNATKFASVTVQTQFWKQFENLIGMNNPVACSALSAIEAHLFVQMFHHKLPLMNCLRKSQVLESMREEKRFRRIVELVGTKILFTVTRLLDDYTITEQGDVGRLVRTSAAKVILDFHELFFENELAETVTANLVRLCGEPNEEIRHTCFTILQHRYGLAGFQGEVSLSKILEFQHIHLKNYGKEVWRGYLMSAGAIHSTEPQIRMAIDTFLIYYAALPVDIERLELCNELVRIIPSAKTITEFRKQPKQDPITGGVKLDVIKTTVTYLNFWHRIMESGIKINAKFNFQGFYAKLYNLHLLNGANLLRLTTIALFPPLVICYTHSKGRPEKSFVNPIIKRLLTIAKREAERNKTFPSVLQQDCIKHLAVVFLELECIAQLGYILECGDESCKLLQLSESKVMLD